MHGLNQHPFDPDLARFRTRTLPIDQVVDLLNHTHAPDRVAEYRAAMLEGARFPPISVVRLGRRFFVADGHKRLTAVKTLGRSEVIVELWPFVRLLRDQLRQAGGTLRKLQKIVAFSVSNHAEARRLLRSILYHWKRLTLSVIASIHGDRFP
jgi:hypothetical protein